jgi:hypothetical protein
MACILTWIDEFSTPMEALQYVAERRGMESTSKDTFALYCTPYTVLFRNLSLKES